MSDGDDKWPDVRRGDVAAALGLLSRLPVPVNTDAAQRRGARAAWAFPLAGLGLGLIAALVGALALWCGLPAPLVAGLVLACLVITTGAMHEDGLADSADGLWGGWTPERRLEIMKDSRIGAYGVIALILALGLRWQALSLLISHGLLLPGVLVVAMLSRAAMVPLMARLPHARAGGLSASVGRPPVATAQLATVIAVVAALLLFGLWGILLSLVALIAATACALIARRKIGGQTGDILGATQQVTELSLLLTLAALAA